MRALSFAVGFALGALVTAHMSGHLSGLSVQWTRETSALPGARKNPARRSGSY